MEHKETTHKDITIHVEVVDIPEKEEKKPLTFRDIVEWVCIAVFFISIAVIYFAALTKSVQLLIKAIIVAFVAFVVALCVDKINVGRRGFFDDYGYL